MKDTTELNLMSFDILSEQLSDMTYLGALVIDDKEDKFNYDRPEGMTRKDVLAMGDIVYFMIQDGHLMKVGKAGGAKGWVSRVNTYKTHTTRCQTNTRIHRVIRESNRVDMPIDIYAIQAPRKTITYTCPITQEQLTELAPIHSNIEKLLTDKFVKEGYDLPFCNQLK